MEYSKKESRLVLLKIIIGIIAIIVILVFLRNWTLNIKKKFESDELRANVEKILEEEGEEGLLSLAGVNVNEIYYDENGVSLILGDSNSWTYNSDDRQNIDIYESSNKSVVFISSTINQSNGNIINNTGSGIILSKKGEILTNYHVVENGDAIIVTLEDQSSYKATIIGLDKVDDIALLSIDVDVDLTPIKLGRSASLKIGQKVLAIGNPFGYDRTLTTGIISGLNRVVQTSDKNLVVGMIQTDASINPGNSGGPLLDGHGEMIGMNTSIYTQGESQGMNFAIPIDTILSLLPDLLTNGKVLRGWLDIIPIQLTKQLASYSNLNVEQGILISQVEKNGEAESAGLKGGSEKVSYGSSTIFLGGDVIIEINGREIKNYSDYYNALLATKMGDKAKVTIIRDDKEIVKTVTLVQRDDEK